MKVNLKRRSLTAWEWKHLKYLRHIISSEFNSPNLAKVKCIDECSVLKEGKKVESFLVVDQILKEFCQKLWDLCKTYNLIVEEKYFLMGRWSHKRVMTLLPMLSMPNFKIPFEMETYAFGSGIRATSILKQQWRHSAFISQAWSDRYEPKIVSWKRTHDNCICWSEMETL